MRLSTDLPSRLGRLAFTGMIALALSGGNLLAQQPAQTPAQRLHDLRGRLDGEIQKVADAERHIPRDTFDPRSVIRQAGADPIREFEWVRDRTLWVPYSGALRGPVGVLMDRMGNSLDRSLLLAELLSGSGAQVRLAHGTIPAPQASKALAALLARDAQWAAALPAAASPPGSGLAQEQSRMMRQAADQAKEIAALVGQSVSPQGPRATQDLNSAAQRALTDHWWAQLHQGSRWVDYDVLLPDSRPGQALATADRTIDYRNDSNGKLPLDDSLCHRLTVRVIAEQWQSGRLTESTVLEHTLRPAEVLGQRIVLTHLPLDWPGDAGDADSPQAVQRVRAAILAQHEWAPVLTIGRQVIIQSSVTSEGKVNPKPKLNPTARLGGGTAGAVSKVGDIFGGLGAAPAPREQGHFTAEWVEYTLQSPGRPDRVIRREVFDLLGPAARAQGVSQEPAFGDDAKVDAGLKMLGQTYMLPLPCQLSTEFAGHVVLSDIVANRKALSDLLRQLDSSPAAKGDPYTPQAAALYVMAALRGQWSPQGNEQFIDSPNLLAYHLDFALGGSANGRARLAFDIVANEMAVRPRSWANARSIRLAQGVLDTNLETLMVEQPGPSGNAAAAFAASTPRQWALLQGANDPRWSSVHLSADVRARIGAELKNGCVALVPQEPQTTAGEDTTAWWAIDPATGTTLGIGPRGYGAEFAGEAMLNRIVLFAIENRAWICVGQMGFQAASMASRMLGLADVASVTTEISDILRAVCAGAPPRLPP